MELGDFGTKLAQSVEPGSEFRFDYDFGDGWEHGVRVLARTAAAARPSTNGCSRSSPTPRTPITWSSPSGLGRPFDAAVFDPDSRTLPCG